MMHLWESIQQKLQRPSTSDWPAVPATIDVVTVIRQEEQKGHQEIVSYVATLTYFYRNPDLQTGDYRRIFADWEKSTAQEWVAPYKGRAVQVHVDPRDPTRSVLLDEDL